jgi:hypothetical protein
MDPNRALDAAIALSKAPTLAIAMQSRPLPAGVQLLVRILSEDEHALTEARQASGLPDDQLVTIAEHYVLRVLLFRGSPAHRVLGVEPGADRGEIRSNMRRLLIWLHPDKNGGDWRAVFASRVIEAWQRIDRNVEADKPRQLVSPSRRRRAFGVSWIALPLRSAPVRPARRLKKRLRITLASIAFVFGVTAPDEVAVEIVHALLATSPFASATTALADLSFLSLD